MLTLKRSRTITTLAAVIGACSLGCATAPETRSERDALHEHARATLAEMRSTDQSLAAVLDSAAGYAVFPSIGKGGALVGGAYGRGIVYANGNPVGYAEINQASFGAQLGGKTFTEVIVFHSQDALARFKMGSYALGGEISAVLLSAGAAAGAEFRDGVMVFVKPRGGLMFDVSITGQKFNFQPE